MDLKITAEFIKEQRKAKGLTQAELAEKLFVSEKTISKWECGKGFPDTSLVLPLCDALGISANELLSGKKLNEKDYIKSAETNLVELKDKTEKLSKFLFMIEFVLGYFVSFTFITLVFVASFVQMTIWLRIVLMVCGFVQFFIGIHFCIAIEKDVGYYECKHCHDKHIPSYKQIYGAMHMGRTRYMKCPKCGKKSWQKKVLK